MQCDTLSTAVYIASERTISITKYLKTNIKGHKPVIPYLTTTIRERRFALSGICSVSSVAPTDARKCNWLFHITFRAEKDFDKSIMKLAEWLGHTRNTKGIECEARNHGFQKLSLRLGHGHICGMLDPSGDVSGLLAKASSMLKNPPTNLSCLSHKVHCVYMQIKSE